MWTPRVLKDGSDSVGALGALNRVYLNIGLFSEEWLLHFNPLIGGKHDHADRDRGRAQELRLLAGDRSADAGHGAVLPEEHRTALAEGRSRRRRRISPRIRPCSARGKDRLRRTLRALPFEQAAAAAARPRSGGLRRQGLSRLLEPVLGVDQDRRFQGARCAQIVMAPDFLDGNYLSAEFRVPVTLLQTNACSPLATNAIAGNIWDNFSSQSYKDLPSVGDDHRYNPVHRRAAGTYKMPGGGRGYTRPASLISVWSTAPFLLNNSVGKFKPEPVGRGAHGILPGIDRTDAVAGETAKGSRTRATRSRD